MTTLPPSSGNPSEVDEILDGIGAVLGSLGRSLLCLDEDFRVVHASREFEELLGGDPPEALAGREARTLLGDELFAPSAGFRRALEAGELREGWGTTLRTSEGPNLLVSVSGAPLSRPPTRRCDPGVEFVVVLRPEDSTLEGRHTAFAGLVARAPSMLRIFQLVEKLVESEATVLITGESGTGKELIARAVHQYSPRRRGPFVAVNCGALPPELLESELFGHVRGAFTGAYRDRTGRFELATEGTIFLDEVGEMPVQLQVKLLRVLQERTFEKVGESRPTKTKARILAATNRDLRRAIDEGSFREDLFYRLRVVPVEVPPLRHRREDIEPVARHLLTKITRRHGRAVLVDPDVVRVLLQYDWPGNVRELENALEYALAVSSGQTIHVEDLPSEVREDSTRAPAATTLPGTASSRPQAEGEQERILAALDRARWNRQQAARDLEMSRSTLWRKMKSYGIES